MSSYSSDDISEFIRHQVGEEARHAQGDVDLFAEYGVEGDDCAEFMSQFGTTFHVSLSDYLWYFHHGEEFHNGALFHTPFPAPNQRVKRIPITPNLLLVSANSGKWTMHYPPHSLPKRRNDVIAGQILTAVLVLTGLVLILSKWFT